MSRLIAPLAVFAVLISIGAFWFVSQRPYGGPFAQCSASTVADEGDQIGGPFELINTKGETVTERDVITEPSLIYFGFTYCPDVCHLDNARNVEAVEILAEQDLSVTPVFITIDPERDTPEVMDDYTFYMDEKMVGLTGTQEQIDAVSKAYRTYYRVHKEDGSENYTIDHSTFTYLGAARTWFCRVFSPRYRSCNHGRTCRLFCRECLIFGHLFDGPAVALHTYYKLTNDREQ